LEGEGPAPDPLAVVEGLAENLRIQDRVAQQLKAFRHEHGALDLETIEARPVFDGDVIRDLEAERRNRAKEIIEDFMIAANGKGCATVRQMIRGHFRKPEVGKGTVLQSVAGTGAQAVHAGEKTLRGEVRSVLRRLGGAPEMDEGRTAAGHLHIFRILSSIGQTPVRESDKRRFAFRTDADA
jgi:exoribonuclease II